MRKLWVLALLAVAAGGCKKEPEKKNRPTDQEILARQDASCPGGTVQGCLQAALEAGRKGETEREVELSNKVCDAGYGRACTLLGSLYWQGRGVEADSNRAYTLYMRGCEAGDAAGCFSAGICHRTGACAEKSDVKAKELLQRACKEGDKRACANLG